VSDPDPRLILSDDGLDASLEVFLLAQAALWSATDAGLKGEPKGLGRGHWRAAVLMKRRPGLGVLALARLTGLSKQARAGSCWTWNAPATPPARRARRTRGRRPPC
jgi:hypothetical protein